MQQLLAVGLFLMSLLWSACQDLPQCPTPAGAPVHHTNTLQQHIKEPLTATTRRPDHAMSQIEATDATDRDTLDALAEDVQTHRDALKRDLQQLQRKSQDAPDALQTDIRRRLIELHRDIERLRLRTVGPDEDFAAVTQARLKDLGQSLHRTYQRLGYVDAAARMDYRQTLSQLQIRHRELERRTKKLQATRPEDARTLRTEVANRIATLGADIQAAALAVEQAAGASRATES